MAACLYKDIYNIKIPKLKKQSYIKAELN